MAIENAKTLNVRIKNKYDSYENWAASGLVLEAGEIAIAYTTVNVDIGNGKIEQHPELLMKVGNGSDTFANLPWLSAKAADVASWAKAANKPTYGASEITGISDYIADYVETEMGISVDTDTQYQIVKVDDYNYKLQSKGKGDSAWADVADSVIVIPNDTAAIEALQGLVGDTKVATQISNAIAALDLANTYEVKGEAAKVQTALETYKTSNDAAVLANTNNITANTNAINAIKDGTTIDSFADVETALAGKETSGAAAQALTDAKAYADGLADNYDDAGAAAQALTDAKAYADGLAKNYDAAGSAAAVQTKLDEEVTRAKAAEEANANDITALEGLVGETKVSEQISTAITGLKLGETYAAKVHTHVKADITDFAHNHAISEVTGLQDALDGKQAAGDYETKTDAAAKLTEAKGYTDTEVAKVQGEVDALEEYVGTIPEGATATNIVAYVQEKTSGIATDAALSELTNRVGAAESAIDAIEADYLKSADKTALQDQITANAGDITALEEKVGDKKVSEQIAAVTDPIDERVATIEGDYLKAADKTELQNQITTNANAIERLTNGVSAEEVDGVNDLIQYVKDHGTEVTGIKADIKANADAIDAIEADYLKAADKTALQGEIDALEGRMDTVEGAVATKAEAADLTALAGRVTTVEGDLNTETTGLKARMTAAEDDIDALETKVGDETVAAQIEAAIEALKIGDYAKAADLTAAIARISQNETDIADLKTRMGTAEGDIDNLETEVAKKANDADLAAIAKTGSTDDLVQGELVLVFDCGGAE